MSSPPKFSIITVCRNEAANIRSTCESITQQAFKDYEWIVIDGASTDQTVKILEEFSHNITKLISEPDNGIYDAMNKGIDLAKGEYVVFMNGGDAFATNQALALVSNAPQKDLIYGDLRYDSELGKFIPTRTITERMNCLESWSRTKLPSTAENYSRNTETMTQVIKLLQITNSMFV